MADNEKESEVVVEEAENKEPELPLEVVEDEKEPVEAKKEEVSTEDAIAKLQKELDEERLARADAEKRAREAANEARKAASTVEDTNLQLINQAISSVKRDAEIYKANYRAAMEAGDFSSAAEAQEGMSNTAAKLLQLENGKTALETAPKAPKNDIPSDPVEAFASQLSPRSAAWVRRNPKCVTDSRLNQKMIAAHNLAVADGYEADSDDYFRFVEQTIGIAKKEEPPPQKEESALSEAAAPAARRQSPPSAPVSRGGNGSRPIVRLTSEEREMAQMMGMTNEEYAKNKLDLKKEGKLH